MSIISKDLAGVGHNGKGVSTDGEINFKSCLLLQQKTRLVFIAKVIVISNQQLIFLFRVVYVALMCY